MCALEQKKTKNTPVLLTGCKVKITQRHQAAGLKNDSNSASNNNNNDKQFCVLEDNPMPGLSLPLPYLAWRIRDKG